MEQLAREPHQKSLRVLVAEEDPRLRRIVRLNLEREGFGTEEAGSLAECETVLLLGRTDLVIISSQLPGFDAQQFSQRLRSQFPTAPVPVVVISFEPEDRLLTIPLRLATFQRKPFDPGELVGHVSRLLQTG